MRSNTLKNAENFQSEADQSREFLLEMATISHKHGIGLAGEPVLFLLERDDGNLAYEIDDDSRLTITSA